MYETFQERTFTPDSWRTIRKVVSVLDEYQRQGYRLTLRQLYYQLVARDFLVNSLRSYKNLGTLVTNARLAGLIDWSMIEDRNRETVIPQHWENPGEIVRAAANSFHIDKWENQPYHLEVMVEKDALSGVLEPICRQMDVGLTANKGYSSSSTMYEIGKRLEAATVADKKVCVFYLGDHDPSGIDMTRDVEDRLAMFSYLGEEMEVVRLALNWNQVQRWKPPENPAKETDARFANYVRQFGESSWELDAVEPATLADLVRVAILERRDQDLWDESIAKEDDMRNELFAFVKEGGYEEEEDEE